ncbi:Wzz/FepE/Etk N-terminal domain-containing protein [Bacillus sp. UNCCL81]|uniref:YveK family protein n=1 Tax=Bacillus sp. UNCCL81 TaxID=1502755 RepID=UPI0008E3F9A5|nr:Wzz/FepE/Etk N-terminal domain-containing protein [Bacillus sp. UNCCL81]SFD17016.1 Capsular polysaccharide biosynthesis protein [Bacillus sp. UNCCL81]
MNSVRPKEIDIKEYFDVIKSRFWIIIVFTILTTSAGYLYQKFYNNYVPVYESSTRIMLNTKDDLSTLMVMMDDPSVLERVINNLHLSISTEDLAKKLNVTRINDSTIFSITAQDNNPIIAKNIANETAKSFKDEVSNILNFKNVQLLFPAKETSIPINQQSNKVIIFAFVMGIVISIALVFLMDSLDQTIKRRSEVEEILGVPVIGIVPNMNKKKLLTEKKKYKLLKNEGENVDI